MFEPIRLGEGAKLHSVFVIPNQYSAGIKGDVFAIIETTSPHDNTRFIIFEQLKLAPRK